MAASRDKHGSAKAKAVFIDRDDTIGGDDQVTLPRDFIPFPFFAAALALLKARGHLAIAFTNQPVINEGRCPQAEYEVELHRLGFDDLCICPHAETETCRCRKPSPFMLLAAVARHRLSAAECYVIGDRLTDMQAASAAGMTGILVRTGCGGLSFATPPGGRGELPPHAHTAENVLAAAEWIAQQATCDPDR